VNDIKIIDLSFRATTNAPLEKIDLPAWALTCRTTNIRTVLAHVAAAFTTFFWPVPGSVRSRYGLSARWSSPICKLSCPEVRLNANLSAN
jgi:hypothetical protein